MICDRIAFTVYNLTEFSFITQRANKSKSIFLILITDARSTILHGFGSQSVCKIYHNYADCKGGEYHLSATRVQIRAELEQKYSLPEYRVRIFG